MTGVLMRKRRVAALAAATLWAVPVLAGCGSDSGPSGIADAADAPTTAATTAPASSTPTPTADRDGGPPAEGVVPGRLVVDGPEEQAVADAVVAYWTEIYRMYSAAEVDRDAFAALATGRAYDGPVDYVAELASRRHRQSGGGIIAVNDVTIDGDTATTSSCLRNGAVNVDRSGAPVEQLVPFYVLREELVRQGPDWRVAVSFVEAESTRCEF